MAYKLTLKQRAVLRSALTHYPNWVGAADAGQRVTLASLHTRGLMDRKRRDGKPDQTSDVMGAQFPKRASCGYYYRPTKDLWADWIIRQRGKAQTAKVPA